MKSSLSLWRELGVVLFATLVLGCASARMSDHESDRLFRQGQYDAAATRFEKGLKEQGESGRDLLLYYFDLGLSLHSAGRYEESNRVFLKADKVAEIKDYTSLGKETATLLVSDNIKDYKAEDFENVLISTYLAMNYALLGQVEDSIVEARRVNHKLHMMVSEGKRKYKQSAFARYLSAILYESEHSYNDAYIDYKNTLKIKPDLPMLGQDLWRCAWLLHMQDEMERWDQQFHLSADDHTEARKLGPKSGLGEIIVLYEHGISPVKKPHPSFSSIPKFYPRFNPIQTATIEVNGLSRGTPTLLEDIQATAIENLDEKYAGIIAKKIAGVIAKEGVGYLVEKQTNSPLLGFLTKVALHASDQADLRSWNLLPKDLQILRIPMEPGTYHVKALPLGGLPLPEKVVEVEAGKKAFVNFRYMP